MEVDTILVDSPQSHYEHEAAAEQAPHVSASGLPWARSRQPFSPQTMGHALPYLDVFTVQSKRLLPVTRKELMGKQSHQQKPPRGEDQAAPSADDPADSSPRTSRTSIPNDSEVAGGVYDSRRDEHDVDARRAELENAAPTDAASNEYLRIATHPSEEMLQSVRLLVEPIAIPDLTHTGVSWQHPGGGRAVDGKKDEAFCVTVPNHTFDETQVKLFYPTGAKNSNMREYIRDTIQAHMNGLLTQESNTFASSTASVMHPSHSAPNLMHPSESAVAGDAGSSASPKHVKTKKKKQHITSPTKLSPQKTNGVSSGARLSGSVSTSGLLNPELARQAKDILAQLRSNTNKINDLIGS